MNMEQLRAEWLKLADDVFKEVADWRLQHPKATLKQIEDSTDESLAELRTRIIQSSALASGAAVLEDGRCPDCGQRLNNAGKRSRSLLTNHNKRIELERSYGVCPDCGLGESPPC